MPYFHLRFDHRSEEDLAKHLDFLLRLPKTDSFTVLESKSNSGTPHTHSLFTDDRSLSRVRAHWHGKFPDYDGKKDKCYQIKIVPIEEIVSAECYLCKGDDLNTLPNVLQRIGKYKLFPTYTDDRHYEYWKNGGPKSHTTDAAVSKTVLYHHMHEMVKPLKKKRPHFFDDVTEYLDTRFPDHVWKINEWQIMHRALYKFHGKNFRPWGPQQIMGELRVLLNHYCYDEYYSHAEDEVVALGYLERNHHYLHTD